MNHDPRTPGSPAPFEDIKTFLREENRAIQERHAAGASGSEIVQRRTALIDRVLRGLYLRHADETPLPVLIAVGGYGRGELNPHSDIDIMLLCRDARERERATPLLYAFWDAGFDIGYSVRTTQECIDLAQSDLKIRTSLLESRLIAGDAALFASYLQRMEGDVFYRKPVDFIKEKMAERVNLRQKYGGSLYLREPNIKESAGGLRDFHTARWIAAARFRAHSFDALVESGIITQGQLISFRRSRDFLWRIRNEIHYLSGRKNDQLTFDLQETASRDFKFRNSSDLLAVERFMKTYFLHARTILEFSRTIADRALAAPRRSWFARSQTAGRFLIMGKTLLPAAETEFSGSPGRVFEAFGLVRERGLELSERLQHLIAGQRFSEDKRASPEEAKAFLALLDHFEGLADTLTLMRDMKVLGRYLPEFRAIQALARHDYYHTYTVDEHILQAIRRLEDVWTGRHPAAATLSDAIHEVRQRWLLTLSVLLHDLGKYFRNDHEQHGGEIAVRILDRLGIGGKDRERILFLVAHHVLMSTLSQRRELGDRKVIEDFSRVVGDRENLNYLYLLTFADMSAVHPGAYSPWKAVLLQELYLRTLAYFDRKGKGEFEGPIDLVKLQRQVASAGAGSLDEDILAGFLAAMPDHYLRATSIKRIARHAGMVARLPKEHLIIEHRHRPDRGYTELTICAYDAYGMFYRTAGILAAENLNVLRAQVYTARSGIMIDTFQITDADGTPLPHEEVWTTVKRELYDVLTGQRRPRVPGGMAAGISLPAAIETSVHFDNDTSASLTIIDITARDRIGLLYRITKTLYDLNLDIASAKITTEGVRAMDSFYVSDLTRSKIRDQERLEKIRQTLVAAVER